MQTIESNKQFSKSVLWDLQRDYFDKNGVDAWAGAVPFYITSNPLIAEAYAQVFIHFMQDLHQKGQLDSSQPLYILELGTGSGRFSYYCLKEMIKLQKLLGLESVKFCYVMTDFTESNLRFWDQHELLKPFVESGHLDFAIFDMESQAEISLAKSGVTLKKGSVKNPIAVVGNYIFDTVTNDVFRVQDGVVKEAQVSINTDDYNVANGKVVNLEKLQSTFSYHDMPEAYYEDSLLNEVVQSYKDQLKETTMMFPIGGLYALDRLKALSNGKLLLVSTDKGYTHLSELEVRPDPRVIFHGSFSMSVNFHAIGEFCKKHQGDAYFQQIRKGIKTCVFTTGMTFDGLHNTNSAIRTFVEGFSPGDYFNMHEHMKKTKDSADLKVVLSHMHLNRWDPHVFKFFVEQVVKQIRGADKVTVEGFFVGMPSLAENVFPMPGAHDSYFDIAILLHTIESYEEALKYYQMSYNAFKKHFTLLYNMGMCHYYIGNKSMALACFKESLTYSDAVKKDADMWIARIEAEQGGNAGRLPGL